MSAKRERTNGKLVVNPLGRRDENGQRTIQAKVVETTVDGRTFAAGESAAELLSPNGETIIHRPSITGYTDGRNSLAIAIPGTSSCRKKLFFVAEKIGVKVSARPLQQIGKSNRTQEGQNCPTYQLEYYNVYGDRVMELVCQSWVKEYSQIWQNESSGSSEFCPLDRGVAAKRAKQREQRGNASASVPLNWGARAQR